MAVAPAVSRLSVAGTAIAVAADTFHSPGCDACYRYSSKLSSLRICNSLDNYYARGQLSSKRSVFHHGGSFQRMRTALREKSGSNSKRTGRSHPMYAVKAALEALIFDCDGVILESEDLHRQAYNLSFEQFNLKCGSEAVVWDTEFYDVLQNKVGGGKPKMRWYFGQKGWPSSTLFGTPPDSDGDRAILIDTLQDWKSAKYKDLIKSTADPRPGVVELMDEARSLGFKVAVCSAATKGSVVFVLDNLLGKKRFEELDCFLAGDDVQNKKPDPSIYITAAEKLGADPARCLVIEDSVIGLQAALEAGMSCIITYTSSTSTQDFSGAKAVFQDLRGVGLKDLLPLVGSDAAATVLP